MLQPATIQFLKNLKKNNNKEWFEAHRKNYDTAKTDFAALIDSVIVQHKKNDADLASLTSKDCVFRINRDIRFSKDKTPYKTNFGASIGKGGRKSVFAGYYFHCEPGNNSFIGGGLWMPEADHIKNIRQEIDYNWDEFHKLINEKKFVQHYKDLDKSSEFSLSREPKGYEKDNPAIDYLKLKSWVTLKKMDDDDLKSEDLDKKIVAAFEALQPLIYFLNRTFHG